MSEKKIEQPSVEYQKMLDAVLAAEPLDVEFRGKRRTIGWLHKGTIMKFSHIVAREENENRRNAKICAVVLLNNIWKIRAFYGIYWRWLYYFCDLDDVEVLRLLETAKKNSIDSILAAYHISDRNDESEDDDDDEGSRCYPSRTSWGAAYSLAEKFPFLFERRYGIRAYDYWWGYTSAQIDLMVADQPLVVYPKKDKGPTRKKLASAYADWKARKEKEGGDKLVGKEGVTFGDFLK